MNLLFLFSFFAKWLQQHQAALFALIIMTRDVVLSIPINLFTNKTNLKLLTATWCERENVVLMFWGEIRMRKMTISLYIVVCF